jgi:hypothetical protein
MNEHIQIILRAILFNDSHDLNESPTTIESEDVLEEHFHIVIV